MWQITDIYFLAFSRSVKETVPEGCKGIPQFWLSLFKNTELLSEMIQDHDEPALKALNDIKITYCEENSPLLEFFRVLHWQGSFHPLLHDDYEKEEKENQEEKRRSHFFRSLIIPLLHQDIDDVDYDYDKKKSRKEEEEEEEEDKEEERPLLEVS